VHQNQWLHLAEEHGLAMREVSEDEHNQPTSGEGLQVFAQKASKTAFGIQVRLATILD
jgi:pyrroloquinoline quinone (PQQ) biosynthesis protein C